MCFWIFHDWKPVEVWEHFIWESKLIGRECRGCGRRSLKKAPHLIFEDDCYFSWTPALNWMKEETLRP